MQLSNIFATVAVGLLGGVSASPIHTTAIAPRAPSCVSDVFRAALFTQWTTECNVGSGHTLGMTYNAGPVVGVCQPLQDDTHAIEVTEIADGCRVTLYTNPVCSNYPDESRTYIEKVGCLWAGGPLYRSYKVTCTDTGLDSLGRTFKSEW